MPGGNRMGPRGAGPKTGRGLGDCADRDQPGYAVPQPVQRSGLGLGFRWAGRGRGRGNRFNAGLWPEWGRGRFFAQPISQDQEVDSLKAQAEELQNTLQAIQNRLAELEPKE
jgi:hypothetical protein